MADFHETPNMYPKLNVPLNDEQHFRLKKSMKLKIILWMRLNKEN